MIPRIQVSVASGNKLAFGGFEWGGAQQQEVGKDTWHHVWKKWMTNDNASESNSVAQMSNSL